MSKRIILLVCILAGLALAALVYILQPARLAVGLQPGSVNYPMMHAVSGGFFRGQGLEPDVRVFRSANDGLTALLGGQVVVDSVIPLQNLAEVEAAQPGSLGVLAFLVSDVEHPLDYLVVPASSPMKSPEELQGKTLVVFPGSYSETMTRLALAKVGVTKMNFLKRSPEDMPAAIQSGQADAGVFYDPVATLSEVQGWGRILERGFWERHLIPEIVVGGYAYNRGFARENPDQMKRVREALRAAIASARSNPKEAKRALLEYLSNTPQEVIDKLPEARIELADKIDPELVKRTLHLLQENQVIDETADFSRILDEERRRDE